MKVEILGTGCHDCLELELMVAEALKKLGISDAQVVTIGDQRRIRRYMALDAMPGLLINGQLVSERQLPDPATLTAWLLQARAVETAR